MSTLESPTSMLQDFLHPAAATAISTRTAIAPLPIEVGEVDLNECSLHNLAALADVAFRAGDRASAEVLVRRLYARYDRQQAEASPY